MSRVYHTMQSNRTKNSDDRGRGRRKGLQLQHNQPQTWYFLPKIGKYAEPEGEGEEKETKREKEREENRGCRKLFLLWGQQYDWIEKLPMRRNNGRIPSPSSKFPGWTLKGVGGFTEFKVVDCSIVRMPSLSKRRASVYYQIRAASHFFLQRIPFPFFFFAVSASTEGRIRRNGIPA